VTNNQIGIASASYNTAYIVPVKVGGNEESVLAVVKGIMYAIEQRVDVINMSLGGPIYTQIEQTALEQAWNQGIISVAAVGNSGNEQVNYPGGNNFVLGVSATNQDNRLAFFSNWGVDVGITAPGVAILSTAPTYPVPIFSQLNYDAGDGTSFSAPFVSGVAALLRAIKPSASNQEVIQAIQRSAQGVDTKDKNWDPFYGWGLLNVSAAVNKIQQTTIPSSNYCAVVGSFYGQVVDSEGNAAELPDLTVFAINNSTGEPVKIYAPKIGIVNSDGMVGIGSDGMFRLFNLPGGNYSIAGSYIDPITMQGKSIVFIASIDVVLGADVYVKLVIPDVP
jgi:thermitase